MKIEPIEMPTYAKGNRPPAYTIGSVSGTWLVVLWDDEHRLYSPDEWDGIHGYACPDHNPFSPVPGKLLSLVLKNPRLSHRKAIRIIKRADCKYTRSVDRLTDAEKFIKDITAGKEEE